MPCNAASLSLKVLSGNPVEPEGGRLKLFAKSGGLYTIDSNGNVLLITPGQAIASIAALQPIAADQMLYTNGLNQFNVSPITLQARQLLDDGSFGAMRTTLGLAIGTNVQAWSADLDSFVTNVSWSGAAMTLTGSLTVTGGIVSTTDITATGDLFANNGIFSGGLNVSATSNFTDAEFFGNVIMDLDLTVSGLAILSAASIGLGGPTITAGSGAPSGSDPDGSIYLQSDFPNGGLWVRENAIWVGPK